MNVLENSIVAGKPRKRYKAPVTIIVGIKCNDGIVVACDSRTIEPSGHVHDDVMKLHVIEFKDRNDALIAEAGNAHLASRLVEMVEEKAREIPLNDYRAVTTCVENCAEKLKQRIRQQFSGTPEDLQRHFEAYGFELMIAHYFNAQPFIFTFDFVLGSSQKINRAYCSLGCGWVLADSLISRLNLANLELGAGAWTAVYAIEEIKKFDSRCGGQTRLAFANNWTGRSDALIFPGQMIQDMVDDAGDYSRQASSEWRNIAGHRMRSMGQKRSDEKSKPS